MSLPKISGIETEFGIIIRGARESDPFMASSLLLRNCEEAGKILRKDKPFHEKETGRRRNRSNPVNLPDLYAVSGEWGIARSDWYNDSDDFFPYTDHNSYISGYESADLMLRNGARFYIDHAHPEYSTPETATPRDLVAADKAGEIIIERCRQRANASGKLPQGQEIVIYKNNSDHKGNSYGCHENYLLASKTFEDLLERKLHRTLMVLVPFLVTRTIFCGAGKVGSENQTEPAGFQLAQRADFFETLIGLQTTHHRPLINIRDEPHADRKKFRRLHVITGDANMSEYSAFLKVGTTQLVLMMLEDDYIRSNMTLEDPVESFQSVSRDMTFQQKLPMERGDKLTALEIQYEYLRLAQKYLKEKGSTDALNEVVEIWEDTLDKLSDNWYLLSTQLDWAIKRNLLERFLEGRKTDWEIVRKWQPVIEKTVDMDFPKAKNNLSHLPVILCKNFPDQYNQLETYRLNNGLEWADYRTQREIYFSLRKLDLEYHDIRRGTDKQNMGLFYRLQEGGAIERLLTDSDIERFISSPPNDTRAFLRGYLLEKYGDRIQRADWGEIHFCDSLSQKSFRLTLPDPTYSPDAKIKNLMNSSMSLPDLMCLLKEGADIPDNAVSGGLK